MVDTRGAIGDADRPKGVTFREKSQNFGARAPKLLKNWDNFRKIFDFFERNDAFEA